jgi:hypothetical protein
VVSGIFLRTPGPNSATARFIGLDSTTRGNWKGVYGADGYSIAEHQAQLPPYAALSFSNELNYVWTNETTDARGLQRTASPGYVASTWFNDSAFEMTLAFNDGLPHQVSFYCLDWDFWGRAQRIEILDAAGAVLASQDLWQFQNGVYAIWEISGSVRIRLSKLAANNAVVSGVFFR